MFHKATQRLEEAQSKLGTVPHINLSLDEQGVEIYRCIEYAFDFPDSFAHIAARVTESERSFEQASRNLGTAMLSTNTMSTCFHDIQGSLMGYSSAAPTSGLSILKSLNASLTTLLADTNAAEQTRIARLSRLGSDHEGMISQIEQRAAKRIAATEASAEAGLAEARASWKEATAAAVALGESAVSG